MHTLYAGVWLQVRQLHHYATACADAVLSQTAAVVSSCSSNSNGSSSTAPLLWQLKSTREQRAQYISAALRIATHADLHLQLRVRLSDMTPKHIAVNITISTM
eukprot:9054-Heterococcus_DN1.PRE.3